MCPNSTRNTMRDPYHWTSYHKMTQTMQTVTVKCFKICRLRSRGGGEKKFSKLTDSIILLHINDHPHVTNRMQDKLNATQWGVFKYPAYSLDLWPYDFTSLHHSRKPSSSHCTMTCRTIQCIGSGSSSRNYLQMGCVGLCINGCPVSLPVVTFSKCCNTFTCEYPRMGFSCTCLMCSKHDIFKFYLPIRTRLKLLY